MAAYRWVSQKKLDEIVNRLQRKTVAYVASNSWVDNQDYHVGKLAYVASNSWVDNQDYHVGKLLITYKIWIFQTELRVLSQRILLTINYPAF